MVSVQNLEFELQNLFKEKKFSEIIFEITTKTQENERTAGLFVLLGISRISLNKKNKDQVELALSDFKKGYLKELTSENSLNALVNLVLASVILSDFENTKQQNLHEFKRFLNVATQIAQGTKSIRQANKIKTDGDKVKQLLTGIKSDETPQMVFKKMSNALVLLSQMITNTADVSKSATLSSVANSVLTRDIGKALSKRR